MSRTPASTQASARLRQAIAAGMVVITTAKQATIAAPPDAENLSDDDWLLVLQAAGEMRRELEALGYTVRG